MRKIFPIHGGIHPPENKHQSTASPIASIPLAKLFVVPLNQHIGAPAEPIFQPGDSVLKGQKIANAQGVFSASVHAPTSGHIIAIEPRPIAHPSGLMSNCVVIEADGKDTWVPRQGCVDYNGLPHHELVERIRDAGIAGMGGAGFPTAVKMNPRADNPVKTLILNGTECEPYITADDILMRERAEQVIDGALLFAKLLENPDEILIGIEDNKPEAIAAMRKAAANTAVDIVVFPTKYPSGGEKQLIEILTGKQVPSGGIPAQIGIVVQNVGTAVAAYRAVRYGEPLISRITTVVGESLSTQQNIDVPIGTPIDHILQHHGWRTANCSRLIIGGPMMGFTVESTQVPVTKTTNCILAPSHSEMSAPATAQPCIRCGMCAQACPASLLPQQLFWYAQSANFDQLREHNLFDCIECGACSYVCPSNIPLVQYYRAAKGDIRKLDAEKEKSDHARQRFEARKARMEKVEAEKEAKRKARKAAAEKAKQVQAEKATPKTADDLVAAAVSRAQSQTVDPVTEKAKLERALSSTNSRIERAMAQLQEAEQEGAANTRIETMKARLKQAEQKAQQAQLRLDQFEAKQTTMVQSAPDVATKITASPRAQLEKTIATLEKRLSTAKQKLAEAEVAGAKTAPALQQGVAKLEQKLVTHRAQLAALDSKQPTSEGCPPETNVLEHNAAQAAIEKAKAKAAAMATLSNEEKAAQQLKSLESRLEKAQSRLRKAQEENNENIEAFQNGVDKLEAKLSQARVAHHEQEG